MSNDSDTADQDAREHHQEVLATHRERLTLLLAQHARLGTHAPPHIIIDIRETQVALHPIKAWLRAKGIPIADEPNDDVQVGIAATPSDQPGQNTNQTINNQTPNQGAQGIFYGPVTFGSTRQDDEQPK
jgi:hypothetical protein